MNVRASRTDREYSDVVHVFEPHTFTLPRLSDYVRDLVARRTFITELASAEIRGSQSSTFLGELWSLADPVFQAAIYYFLFVVIRGASGNSNSTTYITLIIGCTFFFNFTRISIQDGGRSILRHKGLVLNAIFPRALLTVSEVYKGLLATWPALALYAVFFVVMRAPISQGLLFIPLLMVFQACMNLGLALMFSTLTVLFKDMTNLMNYILRILTFSTPVIYPVASLQPNIKTLLIWNPLFPLFSAYQAIITGSSPTGGQIFASLFWSIVLVAIGTWMFLRRERSFALYV